jgi:hypothetical protein
MIIHLTMKTPNALDYACQEAAEAEAERLHGSDNATAEDAIEDIRMNLHDYCAKWFEYGEYVRLEIDTEQGTCVVIPRK